MPPNEKDDQDEEIVVNDGDEGGDEKPGDDKEDRGDEVIPPATKKDKDADAEEDDADSDGKAEEDENEEPAARGKRQPGFIPKPRFDEVNEGLKTERAARLKLEEEVARLRGTQPPAPKKEERPKFDFDAKEDEYTEALIEGDKKKAAAIRKEINAALRTDAEDSAYERAVNTSRNDRAKELLEDAAAEMCEDFPFLDEKSPDANSSAIRQVLALRNDYIRVDAMRPDLALRKAAKEIGELYAAKRPAAKKEDGEDEEKDGDEQTPEERLRAKRDELAVRRGAKDAAKQPPPLPGAGTRAKEGKVDVEKMSDSEFKNMSERERKRARGDIV